MSDELLTDTEREMDSYRAENERIRAGEAAIAAQQPQPAPELGAVTSNRLGHALAALREIRDACEPGTAVHDTAHAALDDDAAIRKEGLQ